jgi:predicted NBD/HSP70 family sugar kinase
MNYLKDQLQKANHQSKNQQLIKETNFTYVFNMIYKYRSISRAQLAKITHLSPTTVSSQVDELLQKKLVIETGISKMRTSGRKPIMLNINENGYYVVSIEMKEEGFDCCLYNLLCKKVDERRHGVKDFLYIYDELLGAVTEILKESHIPEDKLIGITIGVPGLIDYENQHIISSTVVPIEGNNDFFEKLQSRFHAIPVFMENESNLCAYAEKAFGNDGNIRNLFYIDVGKGIGGGIILDGNMYRGSFGLAGEIGHISIDFNGPRCKCGNKGCLEIMANIPSIIQKVIFEIMSGRETTIKEVSKNDLNKINTDVISYAAEMGDKLALEVIKENAGKLAFGINNVINLFNPQTIVIGGEVTKYGLSFLEEVKRQLHEIELKPNIPKINVRYSKLKENACTLGGACYMLDTIFHTPKMLRNGA